jgi:hypothetical protein
MDKLSRPLLNKIFEDDALPAMQPWHVLFSHITNKFVQGVLRRCLCGVEGLGIHLQGA